MEKNWKYDQIDLLQNSQSFELSSFPVGFIIYGNDMKFSSIKGLG